MLLDYLLLWFLTRMPKLKIEEAGSLSKYERQMLQRLYTQGAAAYGFVRNLAKASILPVSKVRQFLRSKDSYTKFTLAARKFKRMMALLDSEAKFVAWILLTLMNWQTRITV